MLLENGAQVDQQTGSGASALISASEKGHSGIRCCWRITGDLL